MDRRQRVTLFLAALVLTLTFGYGWMLMHPPATPVPPRVRVDADAAGPALEASPGTYEPGEVLVEARESAVARIDANLRRHIPEESCEVRPASHMGDEVMVRVHVPQGEEQAAIAWLSSEPGVDSAEPDYLAHAYGDPVKEPNDPLWPYLWNMRKVNALQAWRVSTGKGVVVAVIDTGVAYEDYKDFHRCEDFLPETFVPGYNAINQSEHANDDHAHGTHVAGTIAEATNNALGAAGLAPDAKIMPVKVLRGNGSGTMGAIADGIRWAADHGANVINMSLGGPFGNSALHDAVKYAYRKGVVIVCAAGNSSSTSVGYPASYPECICVSSVRDDNQLAWYSNRGKRIDIAAPGGDLTVDQNNDGYLDGILQNTIERQNPGKEGYFLFQGTSMASPHVAAAAALVEALGITNPAAVKAILQKSAYRKGLDLDKGYGAGVLDAGNAVKRAVLETGMARGVLALVLLIVALRLGRGGAYAGWSPLTLLGLVLGGCGLFFLPFVTDQTIPYADFLCRPLPDWGLTLFGLKGHANPLFYSALVPALVAIPLSRLSKLTQHLLTGFCVGVSSVLLYEALAGTATLRYVPHFLGLSMAWLVVNAALCMFLAVGLADARPRR